LKAPSLGEHEVEKNRGKLIEFLDQAARDSVAGREVNSEEP
jgi:hypothetical protein